jgi:hypothetical protein
MNEQRALLASFANRFQRPDSSISRARPLQRGARGRVSWPSDVNDVHRKWLRKGRRYRLVLRGARGRNVDLFVYKPGTKEIWQIEASCLNGSRFCKLQLVRASPGSTEKATFRPRRSGVYYLQVSSFFARGKYTLKVTRARQ